MRRMALVMAILQLAGALAGLQVLCPCPAPESETVADCCARMKPGVDCCAPPMEMSAAPAPVRPETPGLLPAAGAALTSATAVAHPPTGAPHVASAAVPASRHIVLRI
jgi:hypothetical protein